MVVGGEAQRVVTGYFGALSTPATQDPDLHARTFAWRHVGLEPQWRSIVAAQQGQHVTDLFVVTGGDGVRLLEQAAGQGQAGRAPEPLERGWGGG